MASITNKGMGDVSIFDPEHVKVIELRDYLRKHGLPVSGSKRELVERVKGSLEIGRIPLQELRTCDENFAKRRNLDKLRTPFGERLPSADALKSGWSSDIQLIPSITKEDLYNYLVLNDSRTFDNKPVNARKQLNAKVFYTDGHIHSVQYHDIDTNISHCYVRAECIKSVPVVNDKKKDYVVWVCLSKVTGRVHAADCTCDAGCVFLLK